MSLTSEFILSLKSLKIACLHTSTNHLKRNVFLYFCHCGKGRGTRPGVMFVPSMEVHLDIHNMLTINHRTNCLVFSKTASTWWIKEFRLLSKFFISNLILPHLNYYVEFHKICCENNRFLRYIWWDLIKFQIRRVSIYWFIWVLLKWSASSIIIWN